MVTCYYKARDQRGEMVSGEVDASSVEELKESLFSDGMIPILVREVKPGSVSAQTFADLFGRVSARELMIFTRQFYTLFKAGVSMNTILETLAKQTSSGRLKNALLKMRVDIDGGATLSQAFSRHPKIFNDLYVSMLSAGEEAGILEKSLLELTRLMEEEEEIKKNIKSATLYPKIVMMVMVGAVVILMMFVMPKFTSFYQHYSAELPIATQVVIATSNFFRNYWYIVALISAGLWYMFHRYYASRTGRFKIDELRFKVPVFGELNVKIVSSRFGHILSSLYRSGLSMPRSLEVVASVIGNEAYALEVRKLKDAIQKGSTLSDAMSKLKYFPSVIIETTAVGERTGSLDEMLTTIADHYELEVAHTIKNLTTLLEPLLLVMIFTMVATLALAIFLPIWNMSSLIK